MISCFASPQLVRLLRNFLFLLVFLALAVPGIAAKKTTPAPAPPAPLPPPNLPHYYFTIDLDPRYQIIGEGVLSEEAAQKSNCYRLVYSNEGKLLQVEYRRAGTPMPDPFFQSPRIDFEYDNGIEHRWYRTAPEGLAVANVDGIQGEELTLDASGYPTQVTNLNASGGKTRNSSGVIRYDRTLDAQGRLVVGQRIGLLGTPITDNNGYYETRSVYDNQGRRIEYGNFDASGNALNNSDGVALTRTTYTLYPDSTLSIESYFDASGLATDEKSSGVHQRQRLVDNRGFLIDEAYFDVDGAPTTDDSGVHERRYKYDEWGNKLSESYFDSDGKPRNSRNGGFSKVSYKYDDKNRVSQVSYFGDDGSPQVVASIGAAVVRQEYNAKGEIVHQLFFDGQGNPCISTKWGAPAIRINVEGDTTTITLRDAYDGPAKNPQGGFASLSYKTDTDKPLSRSNHYFSKTGRRLSYFPRVAVINPHLYAMRQNLVMQNSARWGALAAGMGALLAAWMALRKSSFTKRRRVYIPSPVERFLGWLAIFGILEGTYRFFLTVYWWWLDHQYGHLSRTVFVIEKIIILFFIYRLYRLTRTMRVLNIGREEMHGLLRDFFARANLKPEWIESKRTYLTAPLSVRLRYFQQKYHAYLAFTRHRKEGRDLARALAQYLRTQVGKIQSKPRSRAIAIYYPIVAFCYLLLAGTAFYTLWQLIYSYR